MTDFTKVEGLGNDFLLFDARKRAVALDAARVIALCDRHRGVGADGILVVEPSERADARFLIWNADGSRAEMCGNGLRCAAQMLLRESKRDEMRLETGAGIHRVRPGPGPGSDDVWVELVGIEVQRSERLEGGARITGRRVRLGNPHFVIFEKDGAEQALRLGPVIERHPAFAPQRTNVEFCELIGDRLKVSVWERGAGATLACGTGAAAAAAAAWADGVCPRQETWVDLPGGPLRVDPLSDTTVGLFGAARVVFSGSVEV